MIENGFQALWHSMGIANLEWGQALMIMVGGVTEFADGNRASLVRQVNGEQKQFTIRIDDLLDRADMSANVDIYPGDIIIVPESFF